MGPPLVALLQQQREIAGDDAQRHLRVPQQPHCMKFHSVVWGAHRGAAWGRRGEGGEWGRGAQVSLRGILGGGVTGWALFGQHPDCVELHAFVGPLCRGGCFWGWARGFEGVRKRGWERGLRGVLQRGFGVGAGAALRRGVHGR